MKAETGSLTAPGTGGPRARERPGVRLLGRRISYRAVGWSCLALLALGALAGIVVPAGPGWDFANFYDTGSRVLAGEIGEIYHADRLIDGRSPQGDMRFWGPPISALFYAPLALLPADAAMVAFKVENTLALGGALALLYLAFRRRLPDAPGVRDRYFAAFCVAAVLFQPLWTVYRVGGQTTPTVLLLAVAALLAYARDRQAVAALLLVPCALIKPFLAPGILLLAVLAGRRFRWSLGIASLAAGGLSLVVLGWPLHREFLAVAVEGWGKDSAWMYNSALTVPVDALGSALAAATAASWPATAAEALSLALRLLAVAVCVTAVRPWRGPGGREGAILRREAEFLVALVAALVVSGVIWEHYLMLLFPLLALLLARYGRLSRAARIALAVALVLGLAQNLVLVLAVRDLVDGLPAAVDVFMAGVKAAPLWFVLFLLWRLRGTLAAGPAETGDGRLAAAGGGSQ